MRKWLRSWLFRDTEERVKMRLGLDVGETNAGSQPEMPHTRFGVLEVMNGKLLEVCSYKRNPHGPDWTTTYWILNDTQPLAEQIATVMVMKGLSK